MAQAMTKDDTKLFNDFKEELRQEFKMQGKCLEKNLRTDISEIRAELRQIKTGRDFTNAAFEDVKEMMRTQPLVAKTKTSERCAAQFTGGFKKKAKCG